MNNKPEGYINSGLQSATQYPDNNTSPNGVGGASFDIGAVSGSASIQSGGMDLNNVPSPNMRGDAGIPLVLTVNVDEGRAPMASSVDSPFKP